MDNPPKPAVIVVRHFDDQDPPSSPDPWCYPMPGAPSVGVPWRRLKQDGIQASLNYATALPTLIQTLNLCPISRVYGQAPQSPNDTQNPFDSVYPVLFTLQIKDVHLLPSGTALRAIAPGDLLPDASHSTLICWDKQTLWGDKQFEPSLFLGTLRRGTTPSLADPPVKAPLEGAQGIYVFTKFGSDKKFDLVVYPTFTGRATTGPQPAHHAC